MYFLVITKDFNPADSTWAVISDTLDENGHNNVGQGKAKIVTDEYGVTVAHEMLQCFQVYHHGAQNNFGDFAFEYDAVNQEWRVVKWYGQQVQDKSGKAISFTTHLYWESDYNKEISGAEIALAGRNDCHLFGDSSTHAGVEDCIMRYDNAQGYTRSDFAKIYLLKSRYGQKELTGITICNSKAGTGVNTKEHKPIPRYSDAEPGFGDCIQQVCISDKYD